MSVFANPHFDHHELVSFCEDRDSGLRAVIAVHNTHLGPALGGCRMYAYQNDDAAVNDVLRLSRGMTYKSALAGLPYGGGKAVILGDPKKDKSRELLLAMGDFIERFAGTYVTAEDSGTGVDDMKIIAERTRHVSGLESAGGYGGDPSPYTAYGVFCGMKAALDYQRGNSALCNIRVAVQGAGAVGLELIALLIKAGAEVYVADISTERLARATALGARIVAPEKLLALPVDILAPCAMGAVINDDTAARIKASIVAGSANNQLASDAQADQLRSHGILYVPDFVINAGGIIDVHYQRTGGDAEKTRAHIAGIAELLTRIFVRSDRSGMNTNRVAELMAEERIYDVRRHAPALRA